MNPRVVWCLLALLAAPGCAAVPNLIVEAAQVTSAGTVVPP